MRRLGATALKKTFMVCFVGSGETLVDVVLTSFKTAGL